MIKIRIAEMSKNQGIDNAYALQKALQCSPTMASRLWKGNFKQIGISTLFKLCELLNCDTSDLLSARDTQKKRLREPVMAKKVVSSSDLLSTVQVAERLGLSRKRVNDYIVSGKLKAVKGKQSHNFVSESDLQEFITNRRGQAE